MIEYFATLRNKNGSIPATTRSRTSCGSRPKGSRLIVQILGYAFTMVAGGNDTTTGLLGGAAVLLTRHPDQRRQLIESPDLISNAVDEFLRLTSPVQGLARTTTRDVEIRGHHIPEGTKVLLLYAAANRDPDEFGPTRRRAITRTIDRIPRVRFRAASLPRRGRRQAPGPGRARGATPALPAIRGRRRPRRIRVPPSSAAAPRSPSPPNRRR